LDIFEKTRTFDLTKKAEEAGVYPYFIPISSQTGPEVIIGGQSRIMLGSNNYLGLTQDARVIEAACKAVEKYGTGCTGSRFMNGTLDLHLELESRLATFTGKQSALVFTTGYQVNLGVISALAGRHDTIVIDKADHASIVDGCQLSHAKFVRYKHNDMEDLERVLAKCDTKHGILLVVDGVFSMEGDLANLPEVVRLKKKYGARLLVDEAHSVGVFGAGGRGTAEHFGVVDECDLIMGTFSKSFASTGGYISGDTEVVYFIRHAARPLIFTAAIPPASAAAALACLNIIETEPERRARLWVNASKMKGWLDSAGFDTGATQSQIIPIVVGEDMPLVYFWKRMYDLGVYTNAAVSPAVEPGHALIRSSYMATHTEEQLARAFKIMCQAGKDLGIVN
jgi:8-amino-7-oxononanoate synthase